MRIHELETAAEMGQRAAQLGAAAIRTALTDFGAARIIVATGASQFPVLANLVQEPDIDWSRVTGFHLDEYLGLPMSHPASFRRYLKERFVDLVPLKEFHYLNGEDDPEAECRRVGTILQSHPVHVAFVGIGENGHLAFNDPPADFTTKQPYLVVRLDEACRRQQLGEGWFSSLEDVPTKAISMSIQQILQSRSIVCSVPDSRKSEAVANTVQGDVTPDVPASILQTHPNVDLVLDQQAAAGLNS